MTTETTLNEGLVLLVKDDPGVSAAAGASIVLFPDNMPPNKTVGIVYFVAGGESNPTFDGRGVDRIRMQFECYAPKSEQAVAMRWALRELLEGFNGALPNGAVLVDCDYIPAAGQFENQLRAVRKIAEFYLYVAFD